MNLRRTIQLATARGQSAGFGPVRRLLAFTLIEMLLVITIIGIIAGLALPHLNIGKANAMNAATRQLLDDVAYARQKAIQIRSPVYMVFIPPGFWEGSNATPFGNLAVDVDAITNLVVHQYTAYALLTMKNVGDQVGRAYPRYLTDWRPLPQGVFISPDKFSTVTPVVPTFITNWIIQPVAQQPVYPIYPFVRGLLPFPTVDAATNRPNFLLPYIAFNTKGQLTSGQDEFIPLSRGSFQPLRDTNNFPLLTDVKPIETPAGNSTSNFNVIHINALTGRAKVERPELQ